LIEHYLDWLAEPHAQAKGNAGIDIDLASFALGFSDAAPTFSVTLKGCGSVQLATDGHTAHFTPSSGFNGLTSFEYTVTGKDGTAYTGRVGVAVQP
jgi:hypothetical protein